MLYRCKKCSWSRDLRVWPKYCPACSNIHPKAARTKRLIKLITYLQSPQDKGPGDTIARLKTKSIKTYKRIARLLAMCDCKKEDAFDKLNKDYPYARNIILPNSDGSSTQGS